MPHISNIMIETLRRYQTPQMTTDQNAQFPRHHAVNKVSQHTGKTWISLAAQGYQTYPYIFISKLLRFQSCVKLQEPTSY